MMPATRTRIAITEVSRRHHRLASYDLTPQRRRRVGVPRRLRPKDQRRRHGGSKSDGGWREKEGEERDRENFEITDRG